MALINPLNFLSADAGHSLAKHCRIRADASDAETSLSVSMTLAVTVQNAGYPVDYALMWDQPHSEADAPGGGQARHDFPEAQRAMRIRRKTIKKKRKPLLAAIMLVQSVLACVSLAGPAQAVPELSIVSDNFGSGDTGGRNTVKHTLVTAAGPCDQTIRYSDPGTGERRDDPVYNEDGTLFAVEQPPLRYTGSALLMLAGGDVDDSRIDSSSAVVTLLPGDGYAADEMLLRADRLSGAWKDGSLTYTLQEGDLAFSTGDYECTDPNSNRGWSILGGDGNGCFTFNLGVSGITCDGQAVNDASFPVRVCIWSRTGGRGNPVVRGRRRGRLPWRARPACALR